MSIWTQKSALIQLKTSLLKFDDLAEDFERSSVSNFSTKVARGEGGRPPQHRLPTRAARRTRLRAAPKLRGVLRRAALARGRQTLKPQLFHKDYE